MKRLSLLLLATLLATAAGSAAATVPRGEQTVPVVPAATASGYSFRKVDWHRHEHRGDRDDRDGGARLYFGLGNDWGPGWWPYGGYPPSFYYSAPLVITQPAPPPTVYISPEQQQQPYYWYYCKSARGYYPYVKQCPDGWLKVVPHPPQN